MPLITAAMLVPVLTECGIIATKEAVTQLSVALTAHVVAKEDRRRKRQDKKEKEENASAKTL